MASRNATEQSLLLNWASVKKREGDLPVLYRHDQ